MNQPTSQNGHLVKPDSVEKPTDSATGSQMPAPEATEPQRKRPKRRGPNYAQLHSKPLPLETHPLPAFHPTHPISLLRLAYTYVVQLLSPPSSHPVELYIGYFSSQSRSVHVTDPQHIRALWEMGFFGKGTLSRSEPSWLNREKARLKAKRAGGGGTAEEATNARREERRLKKMERARAEAEKIERQRLIEEGKLDPGALEVAESNDVPEMITESQKPGVEAGNPIPLPAANTTVIINHAEEAEEEDEPQIEPQEFLQLTLEEAFFLVYGLGILNLHPSPGTAPTTAHLLTTFCNHSFFPPRPALPPSLGNPSIRPDDPFLLSYAAYHHFRSLGWVVRPGVKFSVDYLLYYRGPVFSHAEFAVLIVPSYTHAHWQTAAGMRERRIKADDDSAKDWWWLHCVNRVQSQVLKSLVLVYVDIPPEVPMAMTTTTTTGDGELDIGKLLKGYRIREFIVKRWVANRSRD